MSPELAHVCGLHNIAAHTRLIQYEGIENIKYSNYELDIMADCNSKDTPVTQHVMMGISCTKNLKSAMYWVWKKMHNRIQYDLSELTLLSVNLLVVDKKMYYKLHVYLHNQLSQNSWASTWACPRTILEAWRWSLRWW